MRARTPRLAVEYAVIGTLLSANVAVLTFLALSIAGWL